MSLHKMDLGGGFTRKVGLESWRKNEPTERAPHASGFVITLRFHRPAVPAVVSWWRSKILEPAQDASSYLDTFAMRDGTFYEDRNCRRPNNDYKLLDVLELYERQIQAGHHDDKKES